MDFNSVPTLNNTLPPIIQNQIVPLPPEAPPQCNLFNIIYNSG